MAEAIALLVPSFANTATFAFLTGGTIGAALVNTAISLGLSAAASALAAGGGGAIKAEDIKGNYPDATSPRRVIIGKTRVGGVRLMEPRAKDGKLYILLGQCVGEIDGREAHYLDGVEVTLDASGFVQEDKYQHNGNPMVQILTRDGLVPSTYYSEIEAAFPDWDSTHRCDGIATALLIVESPPASKFNSMFPNRIPVYESLMRGRKLYDPRTGLTEWSQNPVLALRLYLSEFMGITNIWDDKIAEQADLCDVNLTTPSGIFPTFFVGGAFDLVTPHKSVVQPLLAACNGRFVYDSTGAVGVEVGVRSNPTVTLTDDDVISIISWHKGKPMLEAFSTVSAQYTDASLGYVTQTAEPWVDPDSTLYASKGQSLNLGFVQEWTQARRLQKYFQQESNPIEYGVVRFNLKGLSALYSDRINVDLYVTPTRRITGVVSVGDIQMPSPLTHLDIPLSLLADDYGSFTSGEYGDGPTVSIADSAESIPTVTNLAAAPSGVQTAQNSFSAGIAVAWDAAPAISLSPLLEYSLAGDDNWVVFPLGEDAENAQIPSLIDGQDYDIRFAWVTATDTQGDYVTLTNITASASTSTPNPPTGFSATDQGGGVAEINITASDSSDNYRTIVYRDGVEISNVITLPSAALTFNDDTGAAGNYVYTAEAENVSGNKSALISTAPTTTTIT